MNIILGGGVVALFARDILGPDWQIIPIGRSIYYSFSPPLTDNYIIRDDITDRYLETVTIPEYIKNTLSVGGYLTQDDATLHEWLNKKYKGNVPPQAQKYWESHMGYFAYPGLNKIYAKYQEKYKGEITRNNNYGALSKIDVHNHTLTLANKTIEYDKLINTIPLYAFLDLADINYPLPSLDMWCYHIRSDTIDLEGATNAFIVDAAIDFYQASKVGNTDYIFYANAEVAQPGTMFMSIVEKFDLINETMIPKAIACGEIPRLEVLDSGGIINAGSGVWDDCLDIGSSIKRLLRMRK
jgi:hypothetical protein